MGLSSGGRVVRDTSYLLTGQVVGGLVGLGFAAWFARHLPADELSMWPVCVTLASIAHPLSNLGTHTSFMRSIPKLLARGEDQEAARMLRAGLLWTVGLTVIVCTAMLMASEGVNRLLLNGELPAGLMNVIVIAVFARATESHLEWFLNAFQEYGLLATARTVGRILRSVGAFVMYLLAGIEGSVLGLAFGSVVGGAICLYALYRHLRPARGMSSIVTLLRKSGPFYISQLYKGAMSRADYILVGAFGGADSLALYYVAYRVIEHLKELDTYVMEALTPKLAEKATEGRHASEEAFTKCSRYFFLSMVPLHLGLAAAGPAIIRAYAGPEWGEAGLIFSVLCVFLVLDGLYAIYRRQIVVAGNRWHTLVIDASNRTVSVFLIALFTYHMGSMGAAVGQLATVLILLPLGMYLIRPVIDARHCRSGVVLGMVGGAIALMLAGGLQLLSGNAMLVLGTLPLAVALYVAFLRHRLVKGDVRLLQQMLPSRIADGKQQERITRFLERQCLPVKRGNATGEPVKEAGT